MKMKSYIFLSVVFLLFAFTKANAQVFTFAVNDHISGVFGDFAKNEIANNNAAYALVATGTNIEFTYRKKNLGFGLRTSFTNYYRDKTAYESDLLDKLGVNSNNYFFTMNNSFYSVGADIGIMYVLGIKEGFQIEPYFYLSLRTLITPLEQVDYFENSTTYTYKKNPMAIYGVNYIPGIKFHWIFARHFGISLYAEYEGTGPFNETEKTVLYSPDSFQTSSIERSYKPKAFNIGLGLSYSFGKGLNEN